MRYGSVREALEAGDHYAYVIAKHIGKSKSYVYKVLRQLEEEGFAGRWNADDGTPHRWEVVPPHLRLDAAIRTLARRERAAA